MAQDWLNIYRNFDDDALAALASVGLVRRAAKDVEADKVAWDTPPDAQHGLLRVDGQLVTLAAGGPARTSCDCPAPGICKHILAAAIWLRTAPPPAAIGASAGAEAAAPAGAPASCGGADAGAGSDTPAAAPSSILVDALAEVMALEPAAVFKAAGVVATRKAAALHADNHAVAITSKPGALLIELPSLDALCRYIAGAGFAGMISEVPPSSRAAVHLLAITAVWRQQGRAFTWPEAAAPLASAPPAAQRDELSDDERQFLHRLRLLVLEVCRSGWAHVSDIVPAQLRALAMSARIESFPRLAAMLRTLAGTTELLARREVSADEREAMRLAARIYALSQALEHSDGDALRALRGRERRSYDGQHALELLPLGAYWWEQRSGAQGMTLSFWHADEQRIVQATLARRDNKDRAFGRAMAWNTHALWSGAGAASSLSGGALQLDGVRLSDDQRISIGGDTRAQPLPPWRVDDPRWQAAGYHDWDTLAAAMRASAGLRGQALDCVLLKPAAIDTPQLNEASQLFHWTLRDIHGQPLVLRLDCAPVHHTRIDNLEGWAEHGATIQGVLVRVERNLHGGRLEPLSVIVEQKGALRAVSLDYEAPTSRASIAFLERLRRMLKATREAPPATPLPSRLEWLETLQLILENKALTGRLHIIDEDRAALEAMQAFLRASGVDLVANTLRRYLDAPDAARALALMYLCLTCMEIVT